MAKKKGAKSNNKGKLHKLEMKSAATKMKAKKDNPFERRFGNEKHSVLNRKSKVSDTAVGRPGLSRSKALEKRKATLLQEFRNKDRTNVFVDKRIGERDSTMTAEEKSTARFAAAEKSRRKKNLFQLGEEEELTHRGRAISDIQKFEDPRSDEEEDEEEKKLNGKNAIEMDYNFLYSALGF